MSDTRETTQPPRAPRGSFLGRLVSALLVIVITTLVVLFALGAAYIGLGLPLDAPRQIGEARVQLETVEAQNASLQIQNLALQTQVAELERRGRGDREDIDEVERQLAELSALEDRLIASDRSNATVVAELRESRDAVALFATTEADRAALIDEIRQRSERVERFLQRLSDISSDAALDLGAITPSATAALPAASTPSTTVTPPAASTPTTTRLPSPTAERSPTARPASPTPSPTPRS